MAQVRVIGGSLADLMADMEAQSRGCTNAEAEKIAAENRNSGKLARKAARRAARTRSPKQQVSSDNWTAEQYRRNHPNSEIECAMSRR